MLRLSDLYIRLGFCSSRKEFKRQVAAGSLKINDMVVEDDMVFLPTGTLTLAIQLDNEYFAIPPQFHTDTVREWMIVKKLP
jgi:tyrosyl-tRNA synthetase